MQQLNAAGKWTRVVEVLPGRTDNMCLQRYRRLQKWHAGIAADPVDACFITSFKVSCLKFCGTKLFYL